MPRLGAAALLILVVRVPAWAAQANHDTGLGELVFKWVNFALLFGLLVYFLRQPLRRYFAGQRQLLQEAIADSHKLHAEAQQRLAGIEQRLARLEEEIATMHDQAAADSAAEQQRIRGLAEREAERILATARAEIDSATRAARLELKAHTARLVVTLAEAEIRQQLTPLTHTALFEAFVRDFDRQQN